MRRIQPIRAGLLIMAGAWFVGAHAADKPAFEKADANDDGHVSVAEAEEAGVAASKARANDLNGDGQLTRADWRFIDLDSETDDRR